MKLLKKFLFIVLAILALILVAALFVDGSFQVERKHLYKAPAEEVFNYIRYLENQSQYTAWAEMDPDMEITYEGIDGTVGFLYSWKSTNDDIGSGEQQLIEVDPENYHVVSELRMKNPWERQALLSMKVISASSNESELIWTFSSKTPYPFNIMNLFVTFDAYIAPDLERGLENLEEILD